MAAMRNRIPLAASFIIPLRCQLRRPATIYVLSAKHCGISTISKQRLHTSGGRKLYDVFSSVLPVFCAVVFALSASGASAATGNAASGEKIFQQCRACHSPDQGVNLVGPSLYNVIGRHAGSVAQYAYSKAM